MGNYQDILVKLESFIRKFYIKKLIKGVFLFLTFGLLFWLVVLSFEYALWLNESWRMTLFLLFIVVEGYFLYRFVVVPLLYLFQLRKGIDNREASRLIGKYFPDVDDRLLNLLELSENTHKSDLLMASIDQRAKKLGPVPFSDAVKFRESYSYAKYILIPLVIVGFIWITGDLVSFFNSHNRVVHYDMAFERPAPFTFHVLNKTLEVLDNQPLQIEVSTEGSIRPESVYIVINGEELLMKQMGDRYTYTLEPPVSEGTFYIKANGWNSRSYSIVSYATPSLVNFQLRLQYPKYLNRTSETITGTGNAIIPEGTKVTWEIEGTHVDSINIISNDTVLDFVGEGSSFKLSNRFYNDFPYELSTSNANVKQFERLSYQLDVVKDANATIHVEQFLDSLSPNESYYTGQVADDYGISKIRVVYYPSDDASAIKKLDLESPNTNVHQFYYTFPSGLNLEGGRNYKLYFEVVDNDGVRGGKVSKSQVFNASLYDDNQLKDRELDFQNSTLSKMTRTLDELKEQSKALSKINDNQKEERSLSFEDKSQIKNFLQKQEQQEALMQKFSQDLKSSLKKDDKDNEVNKMLQERLERQEMEAKKNAELLKELDKIADKIDKEELQKRLEELGKNQGKNTRNLEQILELTKRYYVTEKMSQLAKDLEKLAERQEILAELKPNRDFGDQEQKELNESFDKLEDELKELEKDNQGLQKPLDLKIDKNKAESVQQDQEDALEEINKHLGMEESSQSKERQTAENSASKKQKSAAQKMQEISQALQQGASGGGAESDSEDAEMLRQILDNLVTFSFKQEKLFDNVQTADVDISQFSRTVKEQQNLRRLFEHVDDSLFALSLRRAELSEFVNEQITEVYYNIDKSLESIAENQIYQGAAHQQYVINATNALADFLANTLDNIQENMKPGQGSGEGSDFQLPDIIKGQQSIQDKMQGSGKKDEQSNQQGEKKGDGQGQQKGDDGAQQNDQEGQKGSKGRGGNEGGSGNGQEEMNLNEVYEIYKEQQFLREQLEQQLEDMLNKSDQDLAKKLIQQMEDFENDLLENGVTERTKSKANNIQHQLMKLENASLEQEEKKERESEVGKQNFSNPIITKPELLKEYQNDIEILNRQALPLRQNYEHKVKVYFDND